MVLTLSGPEGGFGLRSAPPTSVWPNTSVSPCGTGTHALPSQPEGDLGSQD